MRTKVGSCKLRLAISALLLFSAGVHAQNISGSIQGALLDPASAPIPNVEVTLTNVATRTAAQTTSNAAGLFVFPIVLAGSYTIQITAAGFKRQEVTGIDITAGEIRDMGPMTLLLGEVREAVTVMDSPPAVQLASGEKSGLVSGDQLNELALKGRDFFDLMTLMPGVVDE